MHTNPSPIMSTSTIWWSTVKAKVWHITSTNSPVPPSLYRCRQSQQRILLHHGRNQLWSGRCSLHSLQLQPLNFINQISLTHDESQIRLRLHCPRQLPLCHRRQKTRGRLSSYSGPLLTILLPNLSMGINSSIKTPQTISNSSPHFLICSCNRRIQIDRRSFKLTLTLRPQLKQMGLTLIQILNIRIKYDPCLIPRQHLPLRRQVRQWHPKSIQTHPRSRHRYQIIKMP